MTLETVRSVLAWCTVINFGILIIWWLFLAIAHDWMYNYQMKIARLNIPEEKFDTVNYSIMAFFKVCVIVFNLAPYLAMRIVG